MTVVKMFTIIDGSPTEIGYCQGDQARLLYRNGLAEERDGNLWLCSPPPSMSTYGGSSSKAVQDPQFDPAATQPFDEQSSYKIVRRMTFSDDSDDSEDVDAILNEAGINTEGWDAFWMFKNGSSCVTTHESTYANIPVNGGSALLLEFRRRFELGHETCGYADSRTLCIGFLDYDTKEYIFSSIQALKKNRVSEEDVAVFGLTADEIRDRIASVEGRALLFGDGGFGMGGLRGPCADLNWGPLPPAVSIPSYPVGLLHVADLEQRHPAKKGSAQECAENIQRGEPLAYRVTVPGWAHFAMPGAHDVIPVFDSNGYPHPPLSEGPVYGLFRRAHDRLFRVWVQGRAAGWDESRIMDDNTYQLTDEHTLAESSAHEHIMEAVRLVEGRLRELTGFES